MGEKNKDAFSDIASEYMNKKPFSLDEFKYIYSRVPRLCVEVIIKTDEGIVLSKRSIVPWKGKWHIPGGTVLLKETLKDAVKRIAKIELGVDVTVGKFLGFLYYPSEEKERGYGWSIGVAFLCTIKSGELAGSEQGEEVRVFRELPENLVEEQKEFLANYL